jgi:hypothetical protein
MDTINTCQPCFELARTFGVMDWIAVGILLVITLIFTFTQKNFFSFSKSIFEVLQKFGPLLQKKKKDEGKKE